MDKKVLIIGGGAAAALIVGVLVMKRANANAQESAQQSTPVYADMGFMSSLAPSSGGVSSAAVESGSNASSGGSGGFDISTVLGALITSQTQTQTHATNTSGGNTDAAILAAIVGSNGSATVSHSTSGTTIVNQPSGDLYDQALTDLYKKEFNRAPDPGGMAFWKNAMMNQGVSIVHIQDEFEHSPEYKKLHPETA